MTRVVAVISILLTMAACSGGDLFSVTSSRVISNPQQYPWCGWSGEVINGKPHGWGVGSCVAGRESEAHRELGRVLARLSDKPLSLYGEPYHDEGDHHLTSKKLVCEGEFALAKASSIDDYITFRGHYIDGRREGRGVFFYPDGSIYIGNYSNDQREGEGALYDSKCRIIFAGRWKEGRLVSATDGS